MAEYIKVMKPLADALDKLQGEQCCFLRYLLPTIYCTKKKLNSMLQDGSVRHCIPLINAILLGIDQPFGQYYDDSEFIIAAVLIPQFRLRFLPLGKRQLARQLVMNALNDLTVQNNEQISEQATDNSRTSSEALPLTVMSGDSGSFVFDDDDTPAATMSGAQLELEMYLIPTMNRSQFSTVYQQSGINFSRIPPGLRPGTSYKRPAT